MVDVCQRYGTLLCVLFLCFLLLSPLSVHTPQVSSEQTNNPPPPPLPKELRTMYKGRWSTAEQRFSYMQKEGGKAYFQCNTSDFKPDCYLSLYDGDWEDDSLYILEIKSCNFNLVQKSIILAGHPVSILNTQRLPLSTHLITGDLVFQTVSSELQLTASLSSEQSRLNLALSQYDESEAKEPCAVYSMIFSLLSLVNVYALLQHSQTCTACPQVAAKTSLAFLAAHAALDMWLCIWHARQAYSRLIVFDYMILGSFWSLALYLLVHVRLLSIAWQAQNAEIMEWVSAIQGYTRARLAFAAFQTRFFSCVLSVVLLLAVAAPWYRVSVPLMHLIFLPQIAKNAVFGYRNILAPRVYLSLGASRLMLSVSHNQLYVFGCPANFLAWQPDYGICAWATVAVCAQVVLLYAQDKGLRLEVFSRLRPKLYSYYKSEEEEARIATDVLSIQSDCVICMTALSLSSTSKDPLPIHTRTMHAPCGHMFHTDCLQHWMLVKLECPTCRRPLPPISDP